MSAESTEVTTSYQPTEQEKGALEAHAGRIRKTLTSPRLKRGLKTTSHKWRWITQAAATGKPC